MKAMDFSVWLDERRRHSPSYGNDEQQRQAGKDALSCFFISESQYSLRMLAIIGHHLGRS